MEVRALCIRQLLTGLTALLLLSPLVAARAAQEAPVEVPFTLRNGAAVVQVKVGGKGPYNMLLSTGSELSQASFEILDALRLTANYSHDPRSVSPDAVIIYRDLKDIRVGDLQVPRLSFLVFDPKGISEQVGVPVHGILGHNFFQKRLVQFDYPNGVVRFPPARAKRDARGASPTALAMDPSFHMLVVEGVLVEGKKLRALVDTSQGGTLGLTPAAAKFLGLAAPAEKAAPQAVKVGSVVVGGQQLTSQEVMLFAKGAGADHGLKQYGAIIGNGMFEGCVVTLDYGQNLFVVERR